MAISHFYCYRSYWHINWHIYPLADLPVDLKGNFRILLLELILADQLAVLPLTRSASGSEGQFQLLLLELILADQLAHLSPPVLACSGQEWQFYISAVRDHIGISTSRSTPLVDLPVDLKGNFRFLLLKIILADQLAHIPPSTGR